MNVQQANQNLSLLCGSLTGMRDTTKAERDAANLALKQAIEEESVKESKPPGYTIHISGSGMSLFLKLHGVPVPGEYVRSTQDPLAFQKAKLRAWRHHDREMARLREEALRA